MLAGTVDSVVLQAEADLGEGGFDRTGVTADLGGDGIWGRSAPTWTAVRRARSPTCGSTATG